LDIISISNKFIIIFFCSVVILPTKAWCEINAHDSIAVKVTDCPELPNVTWWKTTRIKIVEYVDFKYRGNWVPYIEKWETYKIKMQRILANNGTALVKSRNVSLHGKKLALHILKIEQRIKVTKCLQGIFSGQLAFRDITIFFHAVKPYDFRRYFFTSNERTEGSGDSVSNFL
jgi:hypothetical protein